MPTLRELERQMDHRENCLMSDGADGLTEQALDLLELLREFRAAVEAEKIRFYGEDIKHTEPKP